MPRLYRTTQTFTKITECTSQNYTNTIKHAYNTLTNNQKKHIKNQLSIGKTLPKDPKGPRWDERVRRLLAAVLTEANFGKFGVAMLYLGKEHPKTRDHWDVERIMTHTYVGLQGECIGRFDQTPTVAQYRAWLQDRAMYANSCGGWSAMILDLIPKNREANRWTQVVDATDLTPDQATNHINATLANNNAWDYCYVRLGCHSWTYERVGQTQARTIQVWSAMAINPPPGFNYAYTLDQGWGRKIDTLDNYKDAMIALIADPDDDDATRTIIADPNDLWGIDPSANADSINQVSLCLKTLTNANVAADIKANLRFQLDNQLLDYTNNGLVVPDA